jgi:hypothetical protein
MRCSNCGISWRTLVPAATNLPACLALCNMSSIVLQNPSCRHTVLHSLSSAGCNCDVGVMATTLRLTIGLQLTMHACFNTG